MKPKKQCRIISLLLVTVILLGMAPLSTVSMGTASAASTTGGTVEVSTWEELKRALEYTTVCSR